MSRNGHDCEIYKRKRKKNGKTVTSRLYRGRYRLDGDFAITEISLGTADKQSAEKKLREIVREKEQEQAGVVAPKIQRTSAERSLEDHLKEFIADLEIQGRSPTYIRRIDSRNRRLFAECEWAYFKDLSPDRFVSWRSQQSGSAPKTLNEYLNGSIASLTRGFSSFPLDTKKDRMKRSNFFGAQGGIDSSAKRIQDCVPMLRIALLRFASSNPFARSLRSLGGSRPSLWTQKKTAWSGLLFLVPRAGLIHPRSGFRTSSQCFASPIYARFTRSVEPFARSLRSLGVLVPPWTQKKTT